MKPDLLWDSVDGAELQLCTTQCPLIRVTSLPALPLLCCCPHMTVVCWCWGESDTVGGITRVVPFVIRASRSLNQYVRDLKLWFLKNTWYQENQTITSIKRTSGRCGACRFQRYSSCITDHIVSSATLNEMRGWSQGCELKIRIKSWPISASAWKKNSKKWRQNIWNVDQNLWNAGQVTVSIEPTVSYHEIRKLQLIIHDTSLSVIALLYFLTWYINTCYIILSLLMFFLRFGLKFPTVYWNNETKSCIK